MVVFAFQGTHTSVSLLPFALNKCGRHKVFEDEGDQRFCCLLCEGSWDSVAAPGQDRNAKSMAAGSHPCVSVECEREQAWSCRHYTMFVFSGSLHKEKNVAEVQKRDDPLHHVKG